MCSTRRPAAPAVSLLRDQFSGYYSRCVCRYYSPRTPHWEQDLPYLSKAADAEIATSRIEQDCLAGRILSPGLVTEGLGGIRQVRDFNTPLRRWRQQRRCTLQETRVPVGATALLVSQHYRYCDDVAFWQNRFLRVAVPETRRAHGRLSIMDGRLRALLFNIISPFTE